MQTNTADKIESPEEKLARLMAENAELSKVVHGEEATVGRTPNHVAFALTVNGKSIATGSADSKDFSSGSRGFYSSSKVTIAGKRYQTSVMLVEIGSKPARN